MKQYYEKLFPIVSVIEVLALFLAFQTLYAKSAVAAQAKASKTIGATKAPSPAEWETLVKEARKEGKLVIYVAGMGDTAGSMRNAFYSRYGINLEFMSGRTTDVIQKLLTERSAGLYTVDIGNGGFTSFITVIGPANITMPLDPLIVLDDVREPTKWRAGKIPFFDKETHLVTPAAVRQRYICINTAMVKPNEISSFNDLLDPKWKGKIAMNDPTILGHGNSWFSYMMIMLLGSEKGTEYMKKLVANQPVLVRNERTQTEWVAKGKYPLMIGGKQTLVESFIKNGSPLKWIMVKEPVPISSGSFYLSAYKNAPHPSAQKVFVNWVLGKEAGEIISKTSGFPSKRADVDLSYYDADLIPGPDDKPETEEYTIKKDKMTKIAGEIFKDLLR